MTGRRTRLLAAALAASLATLLAAPASASYQRPGWLEHVSVASDGTPGNAMSWYPSLSADGRYVAFHSGASNLVPGITNTAPDVFVHDRQTRATELVSVASDGAQGNASSNFPSISADGRFVAFQSLASNLVAEDTNNRRDILVHDRETGVTERVSVASDGTESNGTSEYPSISADGRSVAFTSNATNLVGDDTNGASDIFVHDRETGVTERVSVATEGGEGNDDSYGFASISADGRHVAFPSMASNLVDGITNDAWDIFVHDRETGVTERVSVAGDGSEGNLFSGNAAISADGRYVAFESPANNFVPTDTNIPGRDVFVHDRETGTTERVSVASDGTEGNNFSGFPSISADGRYVAFNSSASNLVPDDTNDEFDVFVHDRHSGSTDRVSLANDGAQVDEPGLWTAISADGRHVAFDSAASTLAPGALPNRYDVFVRDRGPAVGVGALSATLQGDQIAVSGWATFSGSVLTSAEGESGAATAATRAAGAELTAASVTYRPEHDDLLLRLDVESLPYAALVYCPTDLLGCPVVAATGGGAPAILYGISFEVDGVRYEARAERALETRFSLYRCDPSCTEAAELSGGLGTTGHEVRMSVPLDAVTAGVGSDLTRIQAFTAAGTIQTGRLANVEALDLPDTAVPAQSVLVEIAAGDEVLVDTEATLTDGFYSAALDAAALSPGDYDVRARACLGGECGAEQVSLEL